jgi:hypothetical protein
VVGREIALRIGQNPIIVMGAADTAAADAKDDAAARPEGGALLAEDCELQGHLENPRLVYPDI